MYEIEMSHCEAYFARARVEARTGEGWGPMDDLQAAIVDSDLQWEAYLSNRSRLESEDP